MECGRHANVIRRGGKSTFHLDGQTDPSYFSESLRQYSIQLIRHPLRVVIHLGTSKPTKTVLSPQDRRLSSPCSRVNSHDSGAAGSGARSNVFFGQYGNVETATFTLAQLLVGTGHDNTQGFWEVGLVAEYACNSTGASSSRWMIDIYEGQLQGYEGRKHKKNKNGACFFGWFIFGSDFFFPLLLVPQCDSFW